MNNKSNVFELFRYQLLPVDRFMQPDLFREISSVEQLLEKKNQIFQEALAAQDDFSSRKHVTEVKKRVEESDFFLYQIAHNKKINRETRDFRKEPIDTWPSILVAVWNHPDKQYIAVQKRTTAFASSETVVKLILGKIEPQLTHVNLRAVYEPLFEKQQFWSMLRQHQGKIKSVEFEIVTPNMANISGTLPDDLKAFAKCTNSTRNKLKIESEPDASLHLDKDNPTLKGLVDYSSSGGGNISVRIDGVKKTYNTARTVKEIALGELEMSGSSEQVVAALKELMK